MHTHATHPIAGLKPFDSAVPAVAAGGNRTSVAVVHDAAHLSWLVPAWEELAANALEPNVFYEHWMLGPAIEAFAAGKEICIVLVLLHDRRRPQAPAKLGGLFPLERTAHLNRVPLRGFRLWRHPHCYLCTPLIRADAAQETLEQLYLWLRSQDAMLTEFPELTADGPFQQALAELFRRHDCPYAVTARWTRALLTRDAAGAIDSPASRDLKRELRRKERRLAEQGALRHVALETGGDAQRWIDDFLRLEASGWKGRRGSALACSPAHRHYFTAVADAAFRRGCLLMHGIDFDGRPIARSCDFVARDSAFSFKTAFDETYARYSPGVLLELHNIERVGRLPYLRWMDSCTSSDNFIINRLWNARRTLQSLAIGTSFAGDLLASAWPLLRWARRLRG
jgi:CelD/BcsL family acetyltransferase involved in cellulose biosynthesis